ncbi:MAG: extracellular solute-binding protein [Phycisphaeraceae bacterium]|nr:extracellular solute-binding protein [Phycisphaeraceae bacterium]
MRSSAVVLFGIAAGTAAVVAPTAMLTRTGDAARSREVLFTVWGMPFEDRLFEDGYARGFEAEEPGVRVEYRRFPDVTAKYTAWHARGIGAEVMRIQVTDYHQMVERGMLEPLDAYIDDPADGMSEAAIAAIPPEMLDALRVNGVLYALPQDMAQIGLYYNRAIFDAWNAANPDDPVEYPREGWTWDDLRDTARKLARRDGGRVEVYGFDMFIWQWPFMNFFAQAGGTLWSDDGLTTLIDSPAGVEAIALFRGMVFEDGSFVPAFGEQQATGPHSRFAEGRTAMFLDGSWMAPSFQLRNPSLDFAVAPVPRGRVEAVCAGACLWGISVHAKHKRDAWRMIRWLVDEPQALRYWHTLRVAPPANLAVVNSDAFRRTSGIASEREPGRYLVPPMREEEFARYAEWLRYGMTPSERTGEAPAFVPVSLYQRALENEISRLLHDILRHPTDPTAEDALARAARAVHDIIDRDRAAKGLPKVERAANSN